MSRVHVVLLLLLLVGAPEAVADTVRHKVLPLPLAGNTETIPLRDWTPRERDGSADWFGGGCRGEACRALTEEERSRYGILLAAAARHLPPPPKGFERTVPLSLGPRSVVARHRGWREFTEQTRRSPELDGSGSPAAAIFPRGIDLGDGAIPSELGLRVFYVPAGTKPDATLPRDQVIRLDLLFRRVVHPEKELFEVRLQKVPFGRGAAELVRPERGSGSSAADVRRAFWLGKPVDGSGRLMVAASIEGPVEQTDELFERLSRTALLSLVGPATKSTDARIEKGSRRTSRPDSRFVQTGEQLTTDQRRPYGELVRRALELLPVPEKNRAKQLANRAATGLLDKRSVFIGDAANLVPAESVRCKGRQLPSAIELVREFGEAGAAERLTPGEQPLLRISFSAHCGRLPSAEGSWSRRLDRWKVEVAEREAHLRYPFAQQIVLTGSKAPEGDARLAPVEHLVVTYEGDPALVRELMGRVDREKLAALLK